MKPRGPRNEEFFQNAKRGEKALQSVFRAARQSGSLNLSGKGLSSVPDAVFCLEQHAEEGEKFWEFTSLSKLDLSHNSITDLSEQVSNLVDLVSLKMRSNQLNHLPQAILSCCHLRHLNLEDNQLADPLIRLESSISAPFPELVECLLSANSLSVFPAILTKCTSLHVLNLSDNQLSSLPLEIGALSRLTHLNLKNNKLRFIPDSFSDLKDLVELDVRKNALERLPDLSTLHSLQVLDAGENKISEIPALPASCNLHRLHIDFNRIRTLPEALFSACRHSLYELHLHDNQCGEIPPQVALLEGLKVLDISNNNLSDLPPSLGYMETLQRLVVEGNPIRCIRRTLLSTSTVELKKYLCTRGPPYLASAGAKNSDAYDEYGWGVQEATSEGDLPSAVLHRLRNLDGHSLDLSNLNLSSLPPRWTNELHRSRCLDSMETSISISSISFSGNQLSGVPKELFFAEFSGCLRELDLSSNDLGGRVSTSPSDVNPLVPAFVKRLHVGRNQLSAQDLEAFLRVTSKNPSFSLAHLLAPYNHLQSIPPSLNAHKSLQELQLANNKLTTLAPLQFDALPCLRILDVSCNRISELGTLHCATALQVLMLENNDLKRIPPELSKLSELRTFSLHGNPQKTIRQAILQKGAEAILSALRAKVGGPDTPSALPAARHHQDTAWNATDNPVTSSRNIRQQCREVPEEGQKVSSVFNARSGGASSAPVEKSESYFMSQVEQLEQQLTNPSLSEAKRFALKKEMAKARANMIRLKRQAESQSKSIR